MLLNELFNKPLDYYNDGHGSYEFKTSNGNNVELEISATRTSEVLMQDLNGELFCKWIKAKFPERFENLTPEQTIRVIDTPPFDDDDAIAEIAFDKNGDFGITGDGKGNEPFEIFSTVVRILEENLANTHYYALYFTANEPSRKKLYSRMIRVLAKRHQYRHLFEPKPGKYFLFHAEFFTDFGSGLTKI